MNCLYCGKCDHVGDSYSVRNVHHRHISQYGQVIHACDQLSENEARIDIARAVFYFIHSECNVKTLDAS